MTVTVAIPVYRVSCKVGIDKGRRWSVIEELLLWALSGSGKTLGELSIESKLPPSWRRACEPNGGPASKEDRPHNRDLHSNR
jgi:hypothetical protein